MKIKKKSMFTGDINSMEIDVSQSQIDAWKNGSSIQDAMPNLSSDEREFIKTGVTPLEWDQQFC
jgi:hypothetical protein